MAVKPLWSSPPQFVDANGDPYSGAFLFFYVAGSVNTKQDTFTDDSGGTASPNPITLNSSGYPAVSGTVFVPFGTTGQMYKIGLAAPGSADPPASFIWTADDISPINDTSVTIDQWVSGAAPTYVSATSFTLVGDQTSTYHVGRRLKTTNSGGTVYSTISASVFGALTTITVVNDSGTLDAGLSAVSYGLLSATNPSTPLLTDAYPIVSGSSDKTKKVRFEVDGLTTATTRVYTLQDSDDTLVGRATTDTLTNKTLVSPVLGTPASGALDNCTGTVVLVAESATTSGTTVNITGIPAGTKRIVLMLDGVSTNGTSGLMVQIGPSGGVENTGYTGGVSVGTTPTAFTTGFGLYEALSAGDTYVGQIIMSLQDSANNVWVATSNVINSSAANAVRVSAGRKALAGVITQLTLTTVSGDTFDAGAIAIQYER